LNSRISFHKSTFYLDFEENLRQFRPVIEQLIRKLYPNCEIYPFRLSKYAEWYNVSQSLALNSEELILLLTYDDHAFIGINTSELNSVADTLVSLNNKNLGVESYGVLSHFPEAMGSIPYFKLLHNLWTLNGSFVVPHSKPLGAILISPSHFYGWFKQDIWKTSRLVSPENPFGPSVITKNSLGILPRREIMRHLDSYQHISLHGYPFEPFSFYKAFLETTESLNSYTREEITEFFLRREDARRLMGILEKGPSLEKGVELDLLKANFRRLSYVASRYVNPEITYYGFLKSVLRLSKNSSQVKKNIMNALIDKSFQYFFRLFQLLRIRHRHAFRVDLPFCTGLIELMIAFTPIPAVIRRFRYTLNQIVR